MMKTVYEAKDMKCCASMSSDAESAYGCLGDRCMAWRWEYSKGWRDTEGSNLQRGYCGMAGPVTEQDT